MIEIISKPSQRRSYSVYDLEWVPGTLQLRMVGVYDEERGYRFYLTIEDFLNAELTHKNRGRWFYAHAGGLADVQFVLAAIKKHNERRGNTFKVDASTSGSSAIIVNVSKAGNKWTFCDSYWLLRDKLKNIGKWIGKSKGSGTSFEDEDDPDEMGITDEEYERRMGKRKEWYATAPLWELVGYNEQDCVILYEAIDLFQDALLQMGGQLQMTLASCAMQLFRRKYLTRDMPTYGEVNDKARKSYFASRVEVFQEEINSSFYYDINSSFPYAMTQPCPGEYMGITYTLPENDKYLYIADVEVEIPDNYITPTPVRRQGRVFFPVGKWRGFLSSIDVELLQREGGTIHKVHEVLLFKPFYDLANYAGDIYNKRKNSTSDFEKAVYKLLLNSLYGKFAESSTKSKLFLNPDKIPITWEEQQTMRMIQLFPGAWSQEVDIDIPHMHVPIATHITSFARRTIYDYLCMCREFHYCDTDGFSTTELLSTGKELGDLKLEKIIREGMFLAPKFYHTDGKELVNGDWIDVKNYKGKGMSRLTAGRFMKLVEGGSIDFERMARVKERWRSGDLTPIETTVTKRIRLKSMFSPDYEASESSLPKRYTYPDGSTRAWQLDELEDHLGKETPYKPPPNKQREDRLYKTNFENYSQPG